MTSMNAWMSRLGPAVLFVAVLFGVVGTAAAQVQPAPVAPAAQREHVPGGEANLILPDLGQTEVGGFSSRVLLLSGMVVSVFGMLFGLRIGTSLKNLPVHGSMREISELIYATCTT